LSNYKPFAFVLMPFQKKFGDIYKYGIKRTAEELEIVAERVDEQHFSETILERVYRQIENSDFVVAEMTGMNPNVFYEVGYAHAKNKLCSLITQNANDIPFDLKHHPHVIYDGTIEDLKNKLGPKLEWLKSETQKRRTETITVTGKVVDGELEKTDDWKHYGSFDLVLDLKNTSSRRSPEIEAIYVKTRKEWTLSAHGRPCVSNLDDDGNLKRSLVTPSLRRLSPQAFAQERIGFRKRVWSKYSGEEQKESYTSKGTIVVEIATSEGTLLYNLPIEVVFEEVLF
jgi:hypothetical protein